MERKWIGLAEVVPNDGSEVLGSDDVGAIVNVVAMADNEREFEFTVERALAAMGLRLLSVQDVELYASRVASHSVDEALRQDADRVPSQAQIAFGTFHTYPLSGQN